MTQIQNDDVARAIEMTSAMLAQYRAEIAEIGALTQTIVAQAIETAGAAAQPPQELLQSTAPVAGEAEQTNDTDVVVDKKVVGMVLENAAHLQSQLAILAQAVTTMGVAQVYSVDTQPTAVVPLHAAADKTAT